VGHVQAAMGNQDEAINEMASALEANPETPAALKTLVELGVLVSLYENPRLASSHVYVRTDSIQTYLEEIWAEETRNIEFFIDQMEYHEVEHRYDVVLAAAKNALACGGTPAQIEKAELMQISALRALGKLEQAHAAAQAYTSKVSDSVEGWVELGQTLFAMGKGQDGKQAIAKALELNPGNLRALTLAFWPDQPDDLLKVKDALPALQAFATEHPDTAGVWRSIGRAKLILGDEEGAMDLFQRALALAPTDDALRTEYWAELAKLKKYEDVLRDAATIEDISKRDWKMRWGEAEAFVGAGKKIEARTAFSAINMDETLHLDVRKRAKRAAESIRS
jgi:tetratricopeptide (TPR) repeat protein